MGALDWDDLSFPKPVQAGTEQTLPTPNRRSTSINPAAEAVKDLQSEIKLLHWHKLANDAALKAAIMKTTGANAKRSNSHHSSHDNLEAKTQWIQQVIEEEQAKPLEVSKVYKLQVEKEQKEAEERLQREIQTHIECLTKLKADMAAREQIRNRQLKYKEEKRQFLQKKAARISGNFRGRESGTGTGANKGKGRIDGVGGGPSRPGVAQFDERVSKAAAEEGKGPLHNVLESLNKLMELEQRITDLESNNIYTKVIAPKGQASSVVVGGGGGGGLGSKSLAFSTKKKESTLNNARQSMICVSVVNKKPSSVLPATRPMAPSKGSNSKFLNSFKAIRAPYEKKKADLKHQIDGTSNNNGSMTKGRTSIPTRRFR